MSIALRGCLQRRKFGSDPRPLSSSDDLESRVTESDAVCKTHANRVSGSARACILVGTNGRHPGSGTQQHSFERSIVPQGVAKHVTWRRHGAIEFTDSWGRPASSLLREPSV